MSAGELPIRVAALGALGCSLILCGVLLMQRVDPAFASLPTGILRDVFPDNPQWVLLGTIVALLGAAAVFLRLPPYPAIAAGADPAARGDRPPRAAGERATSLRRTVGVRHGADPLKPSALLLGLAALVLYGSVLARAPEHPTGLGVLLCLVAAVVCGGAAIAAAAGPRRTPALARLGWADWAAIAAVVAAAVAINAHDLRGWVYAYVGDEWDFYALARQFAGGAPFDPLSQSGVYGIHPIVDSLYQALVMKIFGVDVVGWRMSCILAFALPIAPLYWLGKAMGGRAFALAGAVLYAACPLLWAFAHIGYNSNDPLLAMIPAAALLYAGLRTRRAWLLFAAGACAGAGWYTLFTGRLMIGVLILVALSERRDGWRPTMGRVAILLGGFLLVALPLWLDNGLDSIKQMLPLVSLSQARTSDPASQLLPGNTVRGLYVFFHATEHDHYTAGALFDVVSAAALCAGCALALRLIRALEARLLLTWFLITLLLTTPLYYVPQVADTRLQVVVPPAALLAALGLCSLCSAIARASGRLRRGLFPLALAVALGAAVTLEGVHFFAYATALPQRWPAYPVVVTTMEAITTEPRAAFILPADMPQQNPNGDLCTVLQGFGIDPWTVLSGAGARPLPYCPTAGASATRPVSSAFLLLDDAQSVARCAIPPTIVYRENQGTLWAFRLRIPPEPASLVPESAPPLLRKICPALAR